jgi:hypothetical protein
MDQNDGCVGDKIPDSKPGTGRAATSDRPAPRHRLLQAFPNRIRRIFEEKDKPKYLRALRSIDGFIKGAAYAFEGMDIASQEIKYWFFEVRGERSMRLHVRNAKVWEPQPGDHILLSNVEQQHVILAIDRDFFGPNHERTGVKIKGVESGREEWVGVYLDSLSPALGKAPAADWVRSEEGSDRKTEIAGEVLNRDKTLAEALADDSRAKLSQIGEVKTKPEPKVEDSYTSGDRAAERERNTRRIALRKDIPETEKKLANMKKELRRLEGVD